MDVYGIARVDGKAKFFFLGSCDLLEGFRVEMTAIPAEGNAVLRRKQCLCGFEV
jgi:hypothetical protein